MADRGTPETALLIDGAYVRRVWRKLGSLRVEHYSEQEGVFH